MRTTRLQRVGLLDLLAALFFAPLHFTRAMRPPHYGFNRGADPTRNLANGTLAPG